MYKIITALMLTAVLSASVLPTNIFAGTASASSLNNLVVTVDQAKVFRVAKPAGTIIIGNPAIVDATVQDDQTLVLTGRSFGVTNLIVLDVEGQPITDRQVTVKGHEFNTVRIYRGGESRETLACAPGSPCEPTLTIGDDNEAFGNARSQIEGRNQLSESNSN